MIREWKAMFLAGLPLFPEDERHVDANVLVHCVCHEPQCPSQADLLLNDEAFLEYSRLEGEWAQHALDDTGSAIVVQEQNPTFNRVVCCGL